jgi:hypothetical protein
VGGLVAIDHRHLDVHEDEVGVLRPGSANVAADSNPSGARHIGARGARFHVILGVRIDYPFFTCADHI